MIIHEQSRSIICSVCTNIFLVFSLTPSLTPLHPNMNISSPRLTRPGRVAGPSIAECSQTQSLQLPPES